MNTTERLFYFIRCKNISVNKFSKEIGVSNAYFSKQKKSKGSIGSHIIEKIVSIYPEINLEWLLTGKGDMLKSDLSEKNLNISSGDNIRQEISFDKKTMTGSNTAQEIEHIKQLLKEKEARIAEKDVIIKEKDNQIREKDSQIKKFLDLLLQKK